MHRDKYGFIGQIQPNGSIEGGDSACWMGHWIYLNGGKDPQSLIRMSSYEVKPGAYVRHPIPEQTNNGFGAYYANPWQGCISRDQLSGIMCGLVGQKDHAAMLRLIKHWALRGFLFSYNTIKNGRDPKTAKQKLPDFTGPEMWALALRGLKYPWMFLPLLYVFDLHMLLSTILRNKSFDTDPINYTGRLLVSLRVCPTLISKLTWLVLDKEKLEEELIGYWCGWRKTCEIANKAIEELDKLR